MRRPNRKVPRPRSSRLPRFDGRARLLVALGFAAALGYVATVNWLVRELGGGAPHPLSLRFQAEKTEALGLLALHAVTELGLAPHRDARRAVANAARRQGISLPLALALAHVESRFDAHAISHTGAMGVMQLMPETIRRMQVADPFDPAASAEGGLRFLRELRGRYGGDLPRALAAYNLGPARVSSHGPLRLPPETRSYVHSVLRRAGRAGELPALSAGPARQRQARVGS